MIAEGFTCQRYGFNVGADKFSLLTIENGKTSIMRLSEWTLISQSQKSHSDRLLDINAIHKGIDFMKVHSYKEKIMEWLFNILEICGYKKDKQCDVIKIRSRMHDITHAIYGSSAKYFVTDDEKFSQRLRLIYHFLDLPITIHDSRSFCSSNFQKNA